MIPLRRGVNVARLSPGGEPPRGTLVLSGSKSFSNRALILGAVSREKVRIDNLSLSDDTGILIGALRSLGKVIEHVGTSVTLSGGIVGGCHRIEVGAAGTVARFLTALIASSPQCDVRLVGTDRMHERPIAPLVDVLRELGATIEYVEREGCLPLQITGKQLSGGSVSLRGDVSSQFLSALLLIAPTLDCGINVTITTPTVSESYIAMTRQVLASFGVMLSTPSDTSYEVRPTPVQCDRFYCEGDASGATYGWGIAAVGKGRVRVENLSLSSVQGDVRCASILQDMGCCVDSGVDNGVSWIEVGGRRELIGVTVDVRSMPDAAPTLAVVGARASGETRLTGIETLRSKECDRVHALVTELSRSGVSCVATEHELVVKGQGRHEYAAIRTYDDHRIAMAFSLLGTAYPGIAIQDMNVVTKSYPHFWDDYKRLGMVIVTTGEEIDAR